MSKKEDVLSLYRATRAKFTFLQGGMTSLEVYALCKAELLYSQMKENPSPLETILEPFFFTIGSIEHRNSLLRAFFELNECEKKTRER